MLTLNKSLKRENFTKQITEKNIFTCVENTELRFKRSSTSTDFVTHEAHVVLFYHFYITDRLITSYCIVHFLPPLPPNVKTGATGPVVQVQVAQHVCGPPT